MGWGNESEYKWFMSHDQGGRVARINLLLWNQKTDDIEIWYAALVTRVL